MLYIFFLGPNLVNIISQHSVSIILFSLYLYCSNNIIYCFPGSTYFTFHQLNLTMLLYIYHIHCSLQGRNILLYSCTTICSAFHQVIGIFVTSFIKSDAINILVCIRPFFLTLTSSGYVPTNVINL